MTKLWLAPVVLALLGCHASARHDAPVTAPKVVTVPEVATWVRQHGATLLDANNSETRREYGVVPGALLLSGAREYPASELPGDRTRKLVFYCGGTMCRASDAAAARAIGFGYQDVNIMRAGIRGWKTAGEPTDLPRS